jgi:putative flippase GtrA
MFKLALVIWVMLGTALAGTAVLVVVSDPSLLNEGSKTIPLAAIAGFILAMPLSYLVSKRIS